MGLAWAWMMASENEVVTVPLMFGLSVWGSAF